MKEVSSSSGCSVFEEDLESDGEVEKEGEEHGEEGDPEAEGLEEKGRGGEGRDA